MKIYKLFKKGSKTRSVIFRVQITLKHITRQFPFNFLLYINNLLLFNNRNYRWRLSIGYAIYKHIEIVQGWISYKFKYSYRRVRKNWEILEEEYCMTAYGDSLT